MKQIFIVYTIRLTYVLNFNYIIFNRNYEEKGKAGFIPCFSSTSEFSTLWSFDNSSLPTLDVLDLSFMDLCSPRFPRVLIYMISNDIRIVNFMILWPQQNIVVIRFLLLNFIPNKRTSFIWYILGENKWNISIVNSFLKSIYIFKLVQIQDCLSSFQYVSRGLLIHNPRSCDYF